MLHSNHSLLATMDYKNSHIAFEEINGTMMINATQMAKPFGQKPKFWLRTQQANDLLKAMSVVLKCNTADLVIVKQGGSPKLQGTWFHEDLALLFAQWLSPEFYIACNTKLKQLLQQRTLELPKRHGVKATLIDGKPLYEYIYAMRTFGNVHTGASRRKKKHPEHFVKRFGRNFVTGQYLDAMYSYYTWKDMSNQLKLEL